MNRVELLVDDAPAIGLIGLELGNVVGQLGLKQLFALSARQLLVGVGAQRADLEIATRCRARCVHVHVDAAEVACRLCVPYNTK